MLLRQFLSISAEWRRTFPQQRTHRRAVRQGLGGLACLGRRTLSRIIWTNGGEQDSWSGEYFLHSRCRWPPVIRSLDFGPKARVGIQSQPPPGLRSTRRTSLPLGLQMQMRRSLPPEASRPLGA